MTLTSSTISVIILMLIFRSTFASDVNVLFPKEFPKERLVQCGLEHDIFGISILDGYLYQFGRCSMVIYPPPLDQYFDENLEHIKFDNGYRYNYSEIIPTTKADICSMAAAEVHEPILLINHLKMPNDGRNQHNQKQREQHDNHYILYFVGKVNGNWTYRTYDFNTITYEACKIFTEGPEYYHIMLTNGDEVKQIVNEMLALDGYALKGDPLTNNEGVVHGYMCMRQADDGINYIITLKFMRDHCEKSQLKIAESFVQKISFTITAHNKVIFISKSEQRMYITNITFVQWSHRTEEFYLEVKPLKDFFVCSKSPSKITHEPITKTSNTTNTITTESNKPKAKSEILIIIPIIIVIVFISIIIGIIIFNLKRKKKIKKINNNNDIMKAKSSSKLLLNVTKNLDNKKAIRSDHGNSSSSTISTTTTTTAASITTSKTNIQSLLLKGNLTKNKDISTNKH